MPKSEDKDFLTKSDFNKLAQALFKKAGIDPKSFSKKKSVKNPYKYKKVYSKDGTKN